MKRLRLVLFVLPLLFVFACSSGGSDKKEERKFAPLPSAPTPIAHSPYAIQDSSIVQDLGNGLLLYVIEQGSGQVPQPGANVLIHYHGMLEDGSVFDSSFERGEKADFSLNQLIKGWQIGLTKVNTGSKIKLVIPPELGYGAQSRPNIPGNSTLIFDIELFSTYSPN